MTDEGDELPDLPVRHVPGRHARVSDAVADVIEHLAVRHRTDADAKRRRVRIFRVADPRPTAAVVAVADFAILPEQIASGDDVGGIRTQRIGLLLRLRRNTLVQKPGGDAISSRGGTVRALDRPGTIHSYRAPATTIAMRTTTIAMDSAYGTFSSPPGRDR